MMCLRKVMRMTACNNTTADNRRIFHIGYIRKDGTSGSYPLQADPWTTLDLAWASEKCWFMPGSSVTITDELGNSKTFIKEK